MIKTLTRSFIGLVALVGLAATAQAAYVPATWTDTFDVGTGVYIDRGDSYDYTHDISFDGFNVGSDLVTNFLLSIDLFDDADRGFELAYINIPGFLGDALVSTFSYSSTEYGGWSIAGLFELNLLGTLSVSITSLFGDFYFGSSELVANGYAQVVPEPSTLALLGIGLLGIAVGARRRKANAAK